MLHHYIYFKRILIFLLSINMLQANIITNSVYPTNGQGMITSTFGWRISTNSYHQGIDIDGKIGDPVYAWQNGIITDTYYSSSFGNSIIIWHNNQYSTRYHHLNSIYVKIGESVTAGQTIAEIGNSGKVIKIYGDGSHLHFEIRKNEIAINPLPLLQLAKQTNNYYANNALIENLSNKNVTSKNATNQKYNTSKTSSIDALGIWISDVHFVRPFLNEKFQTPHKTWGLSKTFLETSTQNGLSYNGALVDLNISLGEFPALKDTISSIISMHDNKYITMLTSAAVLDFNLSICGTYGETKYIHYYYGIGISLSILELTGNLISYNSSSISDQYKIGEKIIESYSYLNSNIKIGLALRNIFIEYHYDVFHNNVSWRGFRFGILLGNFETN